MLALTHAPVTRIAVALVSNFASIDTSHLMVEGIWDMRSPEMQALCDPAILDERDKPLPVGFVHNWPEYG